MRWNLRLLLNPTEASHRAVVSAVDAVTEDLLKHDLDAAALTHRIDAVATATQVVIRQAWQRVESGS